MASSSSIAASPEPRPGDGEHAQVQQRMTAVRRDPPFHRDERDRQHETGSDAGQQPGGPVLLVPEHQRQHRGEHGRHRDGQPGQVEPRTASSPSPSPSPSPSLSLSPNPSPPGQPSTPRPARRAG